MINAVPRKLRPAIGGGFVIQAKDGQEYISGRDRDWDPRSGIWLGYPCDENDKVIQRLPMAGVFPVYEQGELVGCSFSKPGKVQ